MLECDACKVPLVKNEQGYACPKCKKQPITMTGDATITFGADGKVSLRTN